MTTWIEDPQGGRARGPRALVRAWAEVLVRPRRFFRNGVGPGDQAPALTFAVVVALAHAAGWMAADPNAVPGITESTAVSVLIALLATGVLAAPVGLHLTAAVATVSTIAASVERRARPPEGADAGTLARLGVGLRERGGVSETVQVVAYASAPFALAGPPVPALRLAAGVYATGLLLVGLRTVHGTTWPRTLVAGLPAALVGYGVAYRAVAPLLALG
ncbi:YIP1 family protein [Haloparvum sedimenti]|uniref:YIP1 family protein n=1 Tax=Haloparvum sedimenti TaxID=1678448 RepID=UPI00071E90AB|nr:YIP1 family protein [Haloparvum sedimenti]